MMDACARHTNLQTSDNRLSPRTPRVPRAQLGRAVRNVVKDVPGLPALVGRMSGVRSSARRALDTAKSKLATSLAEVGRCRLNPG